MLSKKLALDILNKGLSTGADYAEIFFEDSYSYSMSIDNDHVETSHNNYTTGVGIRLLKNLQSVYGYTSDLSKKSLMALVTSLAASFDGEQTLFIKDLKVKKYKTINPINKDYDETNKEEKIALIRDGLEAIKDYDPRIVRKIASWNDIHRNVVIYNSRGDIVKTNQQYASAHYYVAGAADGGLQSGSEGPSAQQDIEFFKGKPIHLKEAALEAARKCVLLLSAKDCPSGHMPVVIGNGWGGVLFHEACGHSLEASSVSKNLSVFSNKKGTKIASDLVSAIDDSTIPNAWGSIDYDDEGIKGEKRLLIKDGILVGYMVDEFNGRRMNEKPNGCCRRQNFAYEPTSRMSNTYICPGKSTKEEIISSVKLGLYCVSFTGGSVNPTTGEFNFAASEAYIIRDGKIAEPVKGATLIGKGEEILKNIDMVGNDLDLGQGHCGAASGSIRVQVGQPTIRVSDILVGGKGGALE